jgi:hypothetical protein
VASPGSAWPRLRHALDKGNLVEARSAASKLEHVSLGEAIELVLLILDKDAAKYERAALRWHARLVADVKTMSLDEGLTVLALLGQLRGKRAAAAARSLAELLYRRGLEQACEALNSWAMTIRPSR